ncbi:hypothetical protein PPL_06727 [Heterostelium album PN500]|uniref:Protein kinase domain-containing protein n=1 Tax=Heterostelium pallidum (strain ATCC 26659 / Pp 5 / PN500) TaxID=670386 RepID=D3BFJ3_HETP5|nr:hypothetical protein PPL_06727 [Heterostelium album PN500]EFA79907.1 hypothetical protein PPL_06727 [Heterostelium album PN500]|eukprot:XP_020432028.1 hypothetical protein PPL_06727 [Heterostelium album PN500]
MKIDNIDNNEDSIKSEENINNNNVTVEEHENNDNVENEDNEESEIYLQGKDLIQKSKDMLKDIKALESGKDLFKEGNALVDAIVKREEARKLMEKGLELVSQVKQDKDARALLDQSKELLEFFSNEERVKSVLSEGKQLLEDIKSKDKTVTREQIESLFKQGGSILKDFKDSEQSSFEEVQSLIGDGKSVLIDFLTDENKHFSRDSPELLSLLERGGKLASNVTETLKSNKIVGELTEKEDFKNILGKGKKFVSEVRSKQQLIDFLKQNKDFIKEIKNTIIPFITDQLLKVQIPVVNGVTKGFWYELSGLVFAGLRIAPENVNVDFNEVNKSITVSVDEYTEHQDNRDQIYIGALAGRRWQGQSQVALQLPDIKVLRDHKVDRGNQDQEYHHHTSQHSDDQDQLDHRRKTKNNKEIDGGDDDGAEAEIQVTITEEEEEETITSTTTTTTTSGGATIKEIDTTTTEEETTQTSLIVANETSEVASEFSYNIKSNHIVCCCFYLAISTLLNYTEIRYQSLATRKLKNIARVYHHINENQPSEYYDYENFMLSWSAPDKYELINKVGRASAEAKDSERNQDFRELKGWTEYYTTARYNQRPTDKNKEFSFSFLNYLNDRDLRYYMFELLKAIEFTHSKGIMHRDIKPHNIAIDHSKRKLYLLDWGLAEFYHPYKNYNVKVASRHYKPPELLVNMYDYDYSIDMWSLGCLFAGLILNRDPFFNGENNDDQLVKIVKVLGTDDFYKYLDKYGLDLSPHLKDLIKPSVKKDFQRYIPFANDDIAHPTAIDFLDKLLRYDPQERMTAQEAMNHPYFSELNGNRESSSLSTNQ